MRAPFFLVLSLALGASQIAAQVDPASTNPEDQVAALIRDALRAPDDQGAWAGLAQGLSNLGSVDRAGLVGMRAAVRIADSLAFSPALAPEVTAARKGSRLNQAFARLVHPGDWGLPTGTSLTELLALPALMSLILASWFLLRSHRTPRMLRGGPLAFVQLVRRVSRVARGSTPSTQSLANGRRDPRALAVSLMETGMPAIEVARRTGMSQDEVSVLLAVRRNRPAFASEDGARRRRSA